MTVTIMPIETTLAIVPKISALLAELIERVKDRHTAALVQQIQAFYQTVQAGYFAAEQKALERQQELVRLESELAALKAAHAEEARAIRVGHAKEVEALKSEAAKAQAPKQSARFVPIIRT